MKIETRFEFGDTIHFICNDKACSSVVQGVKIEGYDKDKGLEITYLCNSEGGKVVNIKVLESRSFKTKQELLNSL